MQEEVKKFVRDTHRGRSREPSSVSVIDEGCLSEEDLAKSSLSYVEMEKRAGLTQSIRRCPGSEDIQVEENDENGLVRRTVDVVLSDMSEPWEQTDGFWKKSLSDPYYRMMNTSGINTKDHIGSMVVAAEFQAREMAKILVGSVQCST